MNLRNIEVVDAALKSTKNTKVTAFYRVDMQSKEVTEYKAKTIDWYSNCMQIHSIWYSR